MDRATPKTDFAAFTITPKDVGSQAVRPGHMAELEEERQVLLLAAKMAYRAMKSGVVTEADTLRLFAAIRIAEGGEFLREAA